MRRCSPLLLAIAVVASAGVVAAPAAATPTPGPVIDVFGIPSAGPASQLSFEAHGFDPGETANLAIVDVTDPQVSFALPAVVATGSGEVDGPIPLLYVPDDVVPGSYVLRITQPSGPSATSTPAAITSPHVEVSGSAYPGGRLDLTLTGLGSRPDIVRSATVDDTAVSLEAVQQHVNISSNPVVGPTTTSLTLPADLRPGSHLLTFTQVAPAATVSVHFTVGAPGLLVHGEPRRGDTSRDVGTRGTVHVEGYGFGPAAVTLTVRDAAGHVVTLPNLTSRGLDAVLPGLAPGVAEFTARSTLTGSTASEQVFVRAASVTTSGGPSSLPLVISPSGATSFGLDATFGIVAVGTRDGLGWHTPDHGVAHSPYRLVLQSDGNLVVYSRDGRAVWSSRTSSTDGPFTLTATEDGRGVLTTAHGGVLWTTPTPAVTTLPAGGALTAGKRLYDDRYSFVVQPDGNAVLYRGSTALWATHTSGNPGAVLKIQSDGNLVLYATNGRVLWANHVKSATGSRLVLQADGNLVEYSAGGKPLRVSNTAGR